LGHTIIALSAPPVDLAATTAWIDHLNSVSDAINHKPAIIVIPFSDIEAAETFAAQAPVSLHIVFYVFVIMVQSVKKLSCWCNGCRISRFK
jgi:hypothetical protein